MSLLHSIQENLLNEDAKIGPVLFKLRFLAVKLGSDLLEEWVKLETEGYPVDSATPDYRETIISYQGTFTNGYQNLNKIGIPPFIIENIAGKQWNRFRIKESMPVIEDLLLRADTNHSFSLQVNDLKLLLDGKVYEDYSLLQLSGKIERSAFIRIKNVVRAKLIDLSLKLEKEVPIARQVVVGSDLTIAAAETEKVTHITQNIFFGPVSTISSTGPSSLIQQSIVSGDIKQLENALLALGLSNQEANELASLTANEAPENGDKVGKRVADWLLKRVSNGVDGVLKIGGKVVQDDIVRLIEQYYRHFF